MKYIFSSTGKKRLYNISINTQEDLRNDVINFASEQNLLQNNLIGYRNYLLSESDWVITKAKETGTNIPTGWKTYRQALRDLPASDKFPDRYDIADWPLAPGETEVPEGAKIFIAEISDPVGLGTTSWIGYDEETQTYFEQEKPSSEPEESEESEAPAE